jgi:hypothetical protein
VTTLLEAARELLRAGVAKCDELLPLAGKVPSCDGTPLRAWTSYRVTRRDLRHPAVTGIGLRLGRVVDVDCDCAEAVELSPVYLRPTFTFGRPSIGRAHWLYVADEPVVTTQFRDPNTAKVIVELRGVSRNGTPMQTMMPGSRHPGGEMVQSIDAHAVAGADGLELVARVGELAVAVMVRRYGEHDPVVARATARIRGGAAETPESEARGLSWRSDAPASTLRRAEAYVAKMDPAISGAGGQRQLFKVAATLVARFGLSVDHAVSVMRTSWNGRCRPPWSHRELRRAAASAAEVSWRRSADLA